MLGKSSNYLRDDLLKLRTNTPNNCRCVLLVVARRAQKRENGIEKRERERERGRRERYIYVKSNKHITTYVRNTHNNTYMINNTIQTISVCVF